MKPKQALMMVLPALGVGLIILIVAFAGKEPGTPTSAVKANAGEKMIGDVPINSSGMTDRMPARDAKEWIPVPGGKGVMYWIVQEGEGETKAISSDKVMVKYTGWRARDGVFFDGNSTKDDTITFELGGVIAGWKMGIPGMKPGEIRRLSIPSEHAYGSQGAGDKIPPNADLIFEVKLLRIIRN